MFNLEEYTKNMLIGLYNDKVYVGSKVRELALNYMIKGYITEPTLIYIDEYIKNAEAAEEVIETVESVEPIEEVIEPVEIPTESEVAE